MSEITAFFLGAIWGAFLLELAYEKWRRPQLYSPAISDFMKRVRDMDRFTGGLTIGTCEIVSTKWGTFKMTLEPVAEDSAKARAGSGVEG